MQQVTRPVRQGNRRRGICFGARCLAALLCLNVAGCAGGMLQFDFLREMRTQKAYQEAAQLAEQGRHAKAAAILWDAAQDLPPPHREKMQIESARVLLDGQYLLRARRNLARIDESALDAPDLLDKRVLEASFYREAEQPARIIALLPGEIVARGAAPVRAAALELLAAALFDDGRYFDSVVARLQRRKLLDANAARDNAMELWQALTAADPAHMAAKLAAMDGGGGDRRLRAWLELAALATPRAIDRAQLEQAYADWRRNNNFLSAPEAITEQLRARWDYLDFRPRKVSLLLPLTGRYGRHGKAIRAGFLRARGAAFSDVETRFYNTDQDKSVTELYRQALAQGAEAVVGPLLKREVEELLGAYAGEAPTITLNYHSDDGLRTRGEVFQFGLLPEDEAIQVAEKLYARGLHHAIALAPDDAWGRRLYRRFEERYAELGGQVREIRHYDVHFEDYAAIVQSLLRLDDSKRRHRGLERIIGGKVRFTPRIRGDVNAAVLFAPAEKAALIYPLLKYYYAEELPVYATSHVYQPQREKIARELDGLIYCDVPLMLDDGPENARPDEYPRLFALGIDAYALVGAIRRMVVSDVRMPGATGVVSVGANRRLFRQLSWAKFSRGKPAPLGESW